MKSNYGFATRAVHAGHLKEEKGATATPIFQTAAFSFASSEEAFKKFQLGEGYVYTRYGNPTVRSVEEKIAALEEAEDAILCSSGMAAILIALLSFLKSGDRLISEESIYGGTYTLFKEIMPRFGIEVTFIDTLNNEKLEEAIKPGTKVLYLESPGNPLLKVLPLSRLANFAKENNLITIVDSTFATPYFQTPLKLGCDLVIHSATKFLGGHGDLTAGVIAGSNSLLDPMRRIFHRQIGAILSPWEAFLLGRGLLTLPLRMEKSAQNAMYLAEKLSSRPEVNAVYYPGLPTFPQYEIARSQMKGFGAVLAFELKGGYQAAVRFQDSLKLIQRVASLGDVQSLITHPASTSHRMLSPEERLRRGITDGLVRLSVGIEDALDLWNDIEQALEGLS
jgi:methionine-gamma-lyase